MRRKTYLKAKKVQTFVDVLRIIDSIWNSIFTLKRKPEFTDNFASHFISRGLTSVPKVEFNVIVTLYITILVSLSPGTCFKSTIRFQSVMLFEAVEGKILHQKGLRGLCTA